MPVNLIIGKVLCSCRALASTISRGVSKVSENVRPSVQRKCHSVMPRWYQMMA